MNALKNSVIFFGILASCNHLYGMEAATTTTNLSSSSETCSLERKFNVGEIVLMKLIQKKAMIAQDDKDRIAKHKISNSCPGHCVVYSLKDLDTQESVECCQPYLEKVEVAKTE